MWYFDLQPDNVESKYNPEFARTFVLYVKTAVYQGMVMQIRVGANNLSYRYWILSFKLDR